LNTSAPVTRRLRSALLLDLPTARRLGLHARFTHPLFRTCQSSDEALAQPLSAAPGLLLESEIPVGISAFLRRYVESARSSGGGRPNCNRVLASDTDNKDFAPEPFTPFYQRSLYQSMRNLVIYNLDLLVMSSKTTSRPAKGAEQVCAMRMEILHRLRAIHEQRISAFRILATATTTSDRCFIPERIFSSLIFEGEPARSIGERRIKRSPLRDVAGMIRSFHYASQAAILEQIKLGNQPDTWPNCDPGSNSGIAGSVPFSLRPIMNRFAPPVLLRPSKRAFGPPLLSLLEKALYEWGTS